MDTGKQKKRRRVYYVETEDAVAVPSSANPSQSKKIYLTYDVLRIIFQFLSFRDLANASMVSRSWLEAAQKEMQTRSGAICFMACSNSIMQNMACIFEKIVNSKVKPCISLYFVCNKTYPTIMRDPEERGNPFLETNKNYSDVIMLRTAGVIMNNSETEGISTNIVCAFLPKISNAEIRTFDLRLSNMISTFNVPGRELMDALRQLPALDEERSTCLMLFSESLERKRIESLINNLNSFTNKISSFWGGLVKNCHTHENILPHPVFRPPYCIGILITGDIKTWSTIVGNTDDTEEKVEKHLREWKEHVQLRKHSIGFMFSCHARGEYLYNKRNVESSVFKSLFPTLQLVGCFGDGEFGKFTLPHPNCSDAQCCKYNCRLRFTQYSTIFMILTYN